MRPVASACLGRDRARTAYPGSRDRCSTSPERRFQGRRDLGLVHGEGGIVLEQAAVEPLDILEPDLAPGGHRAEELPRQRRELLGLPARVLQHAGEHVAGEQAHVLGEHAEHQPVHEVGYLLRFVALVTEGLREPCEGTGRSFSQRLYGLARPEPLRVGHRPLELVPDGGVQEVVQLELQRLADRVGPVCPDPEPPHVRDDQQGRVLQRERVLPELIERSIEVRVLPLVLPRKAVTLPHVRPPAPAGVLDRSALEAVVVPRGVGLGRRRFAKQPAQVDEVLLGGGPLLQHRGVPLGDELGGGQREVSPRSRGLSQDRDSSYHRPRFAKGGAPR